MQINCCSNSFWLKVLLWRCGFPPQSMIHFNSVCQVGPLCCYVSPKKGWRNRGPKRTGPLTRNRGLPAPVPDPARSNQLNWIRVTGQQSSSFKEKIPSKTKKIPAVPTNGTFCSTIFFTNLLQCRKIWFLLDDVGKQLCQKKTIVSMGLVGI